MTGIRQEVLALEELLNGNPARNALTERTQHTVRSRLGRIITGLSASTYGPTQTHRQQFGYAQAELEQVRSRLTTLVESTIPALEAELTAAGAPWVPGAKIP